MAKVKTIYVCQSCGAQRPKWEGQCHDCGEWNTLIEEVQTPTPNPSSQRGWSVRDTHIPVQKPIALNAEVVENQMPRVQTGFRELDRVLGGGLVSGMYVLLGGDPGIGKSTLLIQMCGGLAQQKQHVLYISGEESVQQSALRAQRLGIKSELVEPR